MKKNKGSVGLRWRSPAPSRTDAFCGQKRVFYHSIAGCCGASEVLHCLQT